MGRYILLTISCTLLFITPAKALEINDDGAKRLETLFSGLIDRQKQALTASGGSLETDGNITIEQADSYYAVTLPAITLVDAEGIKGEIGLIAINASPTKDPDNWKMSIALPTPILYSDKDGNPTMQLDIGSQRMGGLWHGKLENFSKLVARYNNIKLSHYKRRETLSIGQLDVSTDLNEGKENQWSGPTKIILSNFNIGHPQKKNLLSFKEARLNLSMENFSPLSREEILTKIQAEDENTKAPTKNLILGMIKSSGNAFSLQGVINALEINTPEHNQAPSKHFSLTSASFDLNMNGMQESIINKTLNIGYRGLKSSANDTLLPSDLNINIALDNLPLNDIIDVIDKSLPKESGNKNAQKVAVLSAMMTLPQALSNAGTAMNLTNTTFSNDAYNVDINGKVSANPASIIGATGKLTAKISGLDKTIKRLERKLKRSTPEEKSKTEKSLKYLQVLKSIGKQVGANKIFNVTLNEQAKISINNMDISEISKKLSQ